LDRHMNIWPYTRRGIVVRRRRRAQPTGDPEPPALLGALRGRDRARAAPAAAVRLQAPARAARGGVRAFTNRSAAAPLSPETGAAHGARRMARPLPTVLVQAPRRPGAAPGRDGRAPFR